MHIKRTPTIAAREQDALPSLKEFVHHLLTADASQLIETSKSLLPWRKPRIDLYVFVSVLNRFDDLLSEIVNKYNLKEKFALLEDSDATFAEAIIDISRIFFEHGSNRGIYSSVPHIKLLLKTANTNVVNACLNLLSKLLSLRYADTRASSRPAALRDLPSSSIQLMIAKQPNVVEYTEKNVPLAFSIAKTSTLEQHMARFPQDSPQAFQIITALRSAFDNDFVYSRIYAASVCTFLEEYYHPQYGFIIDLINPKSTASAEVKRAAYDALTDIYYCQADMTDLNRQLMVALGSMQLTASLSKMLKQMKDRDLDAETSIAFFRLLGHADSISNIPIRLLLDFVKDGSIPEYMAVQTSVMVTLYKSLMDNNSSISPFLEESGLTIIINTLASEIVPEKLADHDMHPPNLVKVDYTLSYEYVQWIKSLLVIVTNVLKHKYSQEVVTQLLNTPMLDVLISVISQASKFGWLIGSMCIQILSVLLKAEQSTISMLLDSPDGLKIVTTLPSSWIYSSSYFPPMFQLMAALLNTEQGIKIVKEHKLLDKLFSSLAESNLYVYGSLNSVGRGIEEINSESPEYHNLTVDLLIQFIQNVTAGLKPDDPCVGTDGTDAHEPPKPSVILLNVMFMLDMVFSNHHVMVVFLKKRGLDAVLDLICHPAIPFDLILSKEMYKPDHAFCHTMRNLFALDTDTGYILETLIGRMGRLSIEITKNICPLKNRDEKSIAQLQRLKALNILIHTFDSMIFAGTPYHVQLAIKHLSQPRYQDILQHLAHVYGFITGQLATIVMHMPENDLVASWPVSACFNIRYSPEDLEVIEKARPHVSESFLYNNFVRCTLTLTQFCITGLMTAFSSDVSRDLVLQRCEVESYKLSEQIARALVSLLRFPDELCEFPMYCLRELGDLCTFVLKSKHKFNNGVLIFFKQMGGITKLFDLHTAILALPEPEQRFRLYLHPKVNPRHFSIYAQQPYLNLYKFLAIESEVLSRSYINVDLVPGFSLSQFYLEVRALLVEGTTSLSRHLNSFYPRSMISFSDLVKLLVKPVRGYPAEGDSITVGPKQFHWSAVRTPERKIDILVEMGVEREHALRCMSLLDNDLSMAVTRLRGWKYPSLPDAPAVEFEIGDEIPFLDGKPVSDLKTYESLLKQRFNDVVTPALIEAAKGDSMYYCAMALVQIPGVSLLVREGKLNDTKLIATMLSEAPFFDAVCSTLCNPHFKNLALQLDPYAITILEQTLAKSTYETVDGVDFCFFNIKYPAPVWSSQDSESFLNAFAIANDLTPLQFATISRLLLFLSTRSPVFAHQLISSEVIWKLFDFIKKEGTNSFSARVRVSVYMLVPILLESENTLRNYILNHLAALAEESNYLENIADHCNKWNGFLARCPRVFVEVLRSVASLAEEGSRALIWNSTLQKYVQLVQDSLEENEEFKKNQQEHQVHLPESPISGTCSLSLLQKNFLTAIIERLVKSGDAYVEAAKSAVMAQKRYEKAPSDTAKVESQTALAQFKSRTMDASFLLSNLTILINLNGNVASLILEYTGSESSRRNFVISHLVRNFVVPPQSSRVLAVFEDKISTSASKVICQLVNIPADTPYTAESVQSYTERGKVVIESLCKILMSEFVNVKPVKFLAKVEWRSLLLHRILQIFIDFFKNPDARLKRFSKVPILPAIAIEKRFPSILGVCSARVDIGQESYHDLRQCISECYTLINRFDILDFDSISDVSDSGDELEIDFGGDSEDYSSSDVDLELEYSDQSPEYEQSRNNIFRNSTLGMFEHDSEDEQRHQDEPPYDQEYDHLSDDEVLSDLDENEDEDDLLDAELAELEEEFDLDDLDMSDDGAGYSENDIDLSDDSAEHDFNSRGDLLDTIMDAPQSDDDFAISDSDHDIIEGNSRLGEVQLDNHVIRIRRPSENLQRPMLSVNANNKLQYWLLTPIWLSPQYIAAEDTNGSPGEFDSDSIYFKGVDLPEFMRVQYTLSDLVPKLCTPTSFHTQLALMFNNPHILQSEIIVKALKSVMWTPEIEKMMEPIYWWQHASEQNGESQWESASDDADMSDQHEDADSVNDEDSGGVEIEVASIDEGGEDSAWEDVDDTEMPSPQPEDPPQEPQEQHIIEVGGRQVNLTELGIDPVFLEALPDNIRDEVLEGQFQQHGDYQSSAEEVELPNADIPSLFDMLGHSHDHVQPQEVPDLIRSIQDLLATPRKLEGWTNTSTKRESGLKEWTPAIDTAALAALLRMVYSEFNSDDVDWLVNLLIDLCANNILKDQIIRGVMSILVNVCKGSAQKGFNNLTLAALSGDVVKSRPIKYISYQYSTSDEFVPQVADLLVQLLFALDRGAPMNGPNGNGSAKSGLDDVLLLLNQVLPLFAEPVVMNSSSALEWIAELSAKLSGIYMKSQRRETERSEHQSNASDSPGSEASNLPDTSTFGADVSTLESSSVTPTPSPAVAAPEQIAAATIPTENINLLITALSSDECSSSAFQYILQTLSDISSIQGVYDCIRAGIIRDGRKYRHKVIAELKLLHSRDDNQLDLSYLSKFTSPTAAQTKLLRVATFIDFLHDTRKAEDRQDLRFKYSELMSIFKAINLIPAWSELSKCLDLIEQEDFKYSSSLLPLIECVTVVSKRVLNAEKENSFSGWLRNKFTDFTLRHRKILNHLVRSNPKLLSGSFAVLSRDSRVLDFDNKLKYFVRRAHEEKQYLGHQLMRVGVRRDQVFLDTYRSLFFKKAAEIKKADIQVNFHGEEGVDAGGVTREWYQILSKQIFNPDYALFVPISEGSHIFQPNVTSFVNPEHLSFFKFVGRIIGKAVYDGRVMSCYFSRALYKYLLKRPVDLQDMETVDEEYYKSLVWMLENDITDVLTETFSVESEVFGEVQVVDLIPNGRDVPVTEENKAEYVKLIVQYKLITSTEQQLQHLAHGFSEMIPDRIRPVFYDLFDERELELLICGLPDIDIDDWRNNTTYQNYNAQSPQIKWFWRCVSSFDTEERAKLLQFATGTSKVPVGGFSQLETTNNSPKFTISRDFGNNARWPSAHTCTNQIDLPLYDSYEQMRSALMNAINEGSCGFGFA